MPKHTDNMHIKSQLSENPPEERSVKKKLEDKWRRDLVRQIGNTHVKERQISLQDVTNYHLQLGSKRSGQKYKKQNNLFCFNIAKFIKNFFSIVDYEMSPTWISEWIWYETFEVISDRFSRYHITQFTSSLKVAAYLIIN